jgi:hypothetical protein
MSHTSTIMVLALEAYRRLSGARASVGRIGGSGSIQLRPQNSLTVPLAATGSETQS